MKQAIARVALGTALTFLPAGGAALAQESVAPAFDPAARTGRESAAIYQLRRKMLDPDFMALTFHTMDQIYQTQTVAAPARPAPLARADRPLDFTYRFEGKDLPAEAVLEDTYTNALLIMKHGKIVYERYRNFTDDRTRFTSMSMAKSITSILAGLAADQGAIKSLEDPVTDYIPELKGSAYDGVTVLDVLDMKTGVDRNDGDQLKPGTVEAARREEMLIRNARPMVDEAAMVGRKTKPGATFDYSTLNATVLGWIVERATGVPLTEFTSRWLWRPLGAETPAYWMTDGPDDKGRPMTGLGFNATLRDYGRVGQMMLDMGRFNGRQILSEDWVRKSTRGPHPAISDKFPRGYQFMWWTVPDEQAFMADGLGGQAIFVDPATDTVIVKLSYVPSTPEARKAGGEAMAFMQAASAWKGR
ncbi:MAG TPA: serine hydrolase [Croceibacterium sp.]|nr:serine hydrolase [Croceibacterium sp.]